ncbi:hypothetical protein HN587_06920 [Candidatus Woesearchaeota archaeon]|jgi:hypothetical protein|nr:hypothetical protein [Candidatus Woesearchaeota archaeon]
MVTQKNKNAKKKTSKPVKVEDAAKKKPLVKTREKKSFKPEDELEKIDSKKETRKLMVVLSILVLCFVAFVVIRIASVEDPVIKTIDDLHAENLRGELDLELGYMYEGYSFVNFEGMWYTQAKLGNTIYDLVFNHGPKELEHITVEGELDSTFFDDHKFAITFDSNATNLKHIAVANGGFSISLTKAFGYSLEAGCTTHDDLGCQSKPAINCGDENRSVIYFKDATPTKIIYSGKCITLQGQNDEIVKAKDKLLMRWYKLND